MKTAKKIIRWKEWDYSSVGSYFVTICTENQESFSGKIKPDLESLILKNQGHINLASYLEASEIGQVVWDHWIDIPLHYSFVELDAFIIMPNHLHGILVFEKKPNEIWSPNKQGPQKNNLPDVIRAFKGSVTKIANEKEISFKWQKRYHDRVIRNFDELNRIRNYILNNPFRWNSKIEL